MELWTGAAIGVLIFIILCLCTKIWLMKKSADEIREGLADKFLAETNTLLDISSRDPHMLRLAEDVNRQLRLLRDARHRFEMGDQKLKETVIGISHDLRTPLTAICGYLDLLETTPHSQETARYLDIIRNRADVLRHLTDELLYYFSVSARPDAKGEDNYELLALNQVLEESLLAYYAALKNRRITPEITMPEQRITRRLNKDDLSRIFENILGNAVKYSDGDLCVILKEDGEIIFSNHASSLNEIETGKLFDRFYTVETAQKSTGLGLSIAKSLTEQMGGTILAKYREGMLSIHLAFPHTLT
ncbi:MAG: HAMP domain-containing histidine kinase [Coprococcus sp.]|nr:HAMP domain-containing histidine kinase [Coprococcus sp.]